MRPKNILQMAFFKRTWKKGNEKQYKFVTSKISIKDDIREILKTKTKIIEVEVLKSNEDFSIIDWTEYNPPKNWFQKILQKTLGLYTNFSIDFKYKTGEFGEFDEVIIDDNLKDRLDLIRNELISRNRENKRLDTIFTPEFILKKITRKIAFFHNPYGIEFSKNPFEENMEFQNLVFQDLGLPGKISHSLVYVDKDSLIGEVELEKKYDHQALKENLGKSLSRLKQLEEEEFVTKLPPMAITEKFWYKLDYSNGWIVKAKYERGILTAETDNILEIKFELLN